MSDRPLPRWRLLSRLASASGMRPGSLRSRLFLLLMLAIVPLAVMAGVALVAQVLEHRRQTERSAVEVTRELSSAVDAELGTSWAALQALGTADALEAGDWTQFRDRARRVLATRPEWSAVLLADAQGRMLASTSHPIGAPLPGIAERDSFEVALRSRAPTVGRLAPGPRGALRVPVRVPVLRGGEVRYVLTAVLRPEAIVAVVLRHHLPESGVIAVFDTAGIRVARSQSHEAYIGQPASPTLARLLAGGAPEGTGVTDAMEGTPLFTAYARSPLTGWTVATGIPLEALAAAPYRALLAYGGGITLSIVAGLLAAGVVARRLNEHMRGLRDAARASGGGEVPLLPRTDIREIREVGDALRAAAEQREAALAARGRALDAERGARAAADEARGRLELLAAAGEALARSLEPEAVLQTIAAAVVPGIADWCRVDLLDADGQLRRALAHHEDPQRSREGMALVQRLRASPDAPGSMAWTVRTGQPYLKHLDGAPGTDPALLEFAAAIGLRAYFIVPLVARGRTLGALAALQAGSGRDLGAADCALVADLAGRAALALDNARLLGESESAAQKAEAANRAKDEFLAMLGHELRNPLAPIVTALHLMRRRPGGDAEKERRIIERQVAHLQRLVDDLLDVSRITESKIQLERQRLDLRQVVAQAVELTAPLFERRARPVELALPDEPVHVDGDPVRLAQVFGNLLNNAAKFTPPEGRVALTLRRDGGRVEVRVEDTGVGIEPGLLPRVFDLFAQGGQAMDRRAGGLGLGLAIVKGLVQLHGGSVAAHSEGEGRGSRFEVSLPAARTEPAAAPRADEDAAALPRGTGRVLVVDDNLDAGELIAELLREAGYEVRFAADAVAALALAGAQPVDAALLDIGLPGMSGYELARALRAAAGARAPRLVALTGYGTALDRARAMEAGFDEHLVKPVAPPRLLAMLRRLLHAAP